MSSAQLKRDPWWQYVALILVAIVWGLIVGLLTAAFTSVNPYEAWMVASGLFILALVFKIQRRGGRL